MVDAVRGILSTNGVGAQPVGGCPFASVVLSTLGDSIRVETTDPNGRKSDRTVASAGSAAAIVESWLEEDPTALSRQTAGAADDVTPRAVAEQPPAPAAAPVPVPAITEVTPPVPPSAPNPRAYFDLDGVAGVGFDGSGWFGGGLSGCAALGRVCLGAGARVGVDPPVSGDSEELETQRLLLDLVALLDYPVRFRGFTLRPGIDFGAAFVRVTRTVRVPASGGEDEDEEEDDEDEGGDTAVEHWAIHRWELALGAHVKGAIQLGKGLALTFGAAVVVFPAADTAPFTGEEGSVAGVPRGVVRGSVGLEYAR